MGATSIILKRDARGRVRTPPERREALIAEFEKSGLPATKFSELAGVRYQTFATWLQRHRQQGHRTQVAADPEAVRFAEVVMDEPARAACPIGLRVMLACGTSLELTEPAQVPLAVQLIKALA